ncbi:General secretion pathway protein G [Candidatus Magnetomorum sp. HK-1]|nr:General secretion pathway protein G [Candidatus Magnetomorum sp. HK-1]
MEKKNKRNEAGFTLIELMVVIVILGILAGLVVPRIMDRPEQARMQKAEVQIESLETACKLFKLDTGSYPASLDALVSGSGRKGGYLEKGKLPQDPWGNDFQYSSGDEIEIWTTAKDGTRISNQGSDGGGQTQGGGHVTW